MGVHALSHCRVEGPILARLAGYPQRAVQQQQRVTAWLPRRVGLLLQADPQLVAAAVEAFVGRYDMLCCYETVCYV
jgi:hypothetical protein